jgi:uncharacterized NAD(P)/FAD-binding protein YdhS
MNYNTVLLGSGISSTQTLLQLLTKLELHPTPKGKIKIAVIEKNGEFFTGIPYGKRSSVNSLTITTFGEFIHPNEKEPFLTWMETCKEDWMKKVIAHGGETATQWIQNNKVHIDEKKWDDIYIPRFLYGLFLNEKINAAIEIARQKETASVDLIHAEAINVSQLNNGSYEIITEDKNKKTTSLTSEKIVIAIGSGTIKPVPAPENHSTENPGYFYINDTYHPSLDNNLEIITKILTGIHKKEERNILIVGSNASSLELIYLIKTKPVFAKLLNKIVVISFSGILPHRITENNFPDYHFENLEQLKQQKYTSTDLIHTVEKDLDIAFAKGVHIGDMYYQLSDLVVALLKNLGHEQEKDFYSRYGNRFTKLIRRAGAEYRDAAQELIDSNKLELIKGSFSKLKKSESGVQLTYSNTADKKEFDFPLSFPIVINCGGFEDLNESSSPLINNLVNKNICTVNATNRGFEVTEKFEANKNLYIMGPLLGGIFNSRVKYWHVENAKRVHALSSMLADAIVESLI